MKKHINIPIFIPHLGCPNQCVFCNQRKISGVSHFEPDSVKSIIEDSLSTVSSDTEAEIAFFGGSFTGIDYALMCNLLEIANTYVRAGRVSSIRCSTRPDYINEDILKTLTGYGVKVIELGLQSTSEEVLSITKRGHRFSDEEAACKLIIDHGFTLVGQMMIGLPGASGESEMETADFIVRSGACAARIYPTVVFRDTELADMTDSGVYTPLSVDEAVSRSAAVFEKFVDAEVQVIRIGLCSSENLSSPESYHSGPNHSALGELVINRYYYNKIYRMALEKSVDSDSVVSVTVSRGSLSKAIGQNKCNKIALLEKLGVREVKFSESDALVGYQILLEVEEKKCT